LLRPGRITVDEQGHCRRGFGGFREHRAAGFDVRIAQELIDQARTRGVSLVGPGGGLLSQVTRTVLQTALEAEMSEHFGAKDRIYPVVLIDALMVKIREGQVANRPVYVAVAVNLAGGRDVLGLWVGTGGEGAKAWMATLAEVRNRGVEDVCIVACDGLKGLPDVIGEICRGPRCSCAWCICSARRCGMRPRPTGMRDVGRFAGRVVHDIVQRANPRPLRHGRGHPGYCQATDRPRKPFNLRLAYPRGR
jgi:hypothetical protein